LTDPLWESGGDGTTPLSPEDLEHLIPNHITLRRELNEAEAAGVSRADLWAFRRRRALPALLDTTFICDLHKRMLGGVWTWAGTYRTKDTNIGVAHREIRAELRKLADDADYWFRNDTFPADEAAVRFHHRLVRIHPFPNGNGRLSRLMGDLLVVAQERDRFSWGARSLDENARRLYLEAIRAADKGDFEALLVFARTP
jgi:Fic-DOC domain mobile mystery protein B